MFRLLAPLFLALLFGCASSEPWRERSARPTAEGSVLVVASDLDNRPFAFVDEDGVPGGRDVEMMRALAARLDIELEWRRMAFSELLPCVERGEVQVVCATLGITAEREERVDFSRSYFETGIALVARVGSEEERVALKVAGTSAMAGWRVGASAGTTSVEAARGALPHSRIVPLDSKGPGSEQALMTGSVNAVAMDAPAARALAARHSERLICLEPPIARESYGLVFPPGSPWVARFDSALAELIASGALTELDERHDLESGPRD